MPKPGAKKKASHTVILSKIQAISPQPFQPDQTEQIKEHLQREGWAAVTVISPEEAQEKQDMFWNFIEGTGNVDRNDPSSWKINWPDQVHGIIKSYGVGQADFMWQLRTNPNVLRVFSSIWECSEEDLLTSFDGACMYPIGPRGGANPFAADETTLWPHRDQHPANNNFLCVQGSVALCDNTGEHDGGLLIWPRTHTIDWTTRDDKDCRGNFYRIKPDLIEALDARVIRVPAGTLLLWDSRTVHANRPPSRDGKTRSVAFICMLDGRNAKAGDLEKRKTCRTDGRTTSHWPFPLAINSDNHLFEKANREDPGAVVFRKKEEGLFSDANDSPIMKTLTCGYLAKE